jgi:hypothetical protein
MTKNVMGIFTCINHSNHITKYFYAKNYWPNFQSKRRAKQHNTSQSRPDAQAPSVKSHGGGAHEEAQKGCTTRRDNYGTGLYVSVGFHFGNFEHQRNFNSHSSFPPKPEGPKSRFQSYVSNVDGLNVFTEVDFDAERLSFVARFCD